MTETRAPYIEPRPHWSETADRQTFVQAVVDLGLDGQAVPLILGVERVSEFSGTLQDAIDVLIDYAAQHRQDLRDELRPEAARHGEAATIAFTEVYLEDGTRINVTARQGAGPDDIVATVLALTDALATLKQFGMRTTKQPQRVIPPVQARDPGPSEFWSAARKYIGPGKKFENKTAVTNWLSRYAVNGGYNWVAAIKELGLLSTENDDKEEA